MLFRSGLQLSEGTRCVLVNGRPISDVVGIDKALIVTLVVEMRGRGAVDLRVDEPAAPTPYDRARQFEESVAARLTADKAGPRCGRAHGRLAGEDASRAAGGTSPALRGFVGSVSRTRSMASSWMTVVSRFARTVTWLNTSTSIASRKARLKDDDRGREREEQSAQRVPRPAPIANAPVDITDIPGTR